MIAKTALLECLRDKEYREVVRNRADVSSMLRTLRTRLWVSWISRTFHFFTHFFLTFVTIRKIEMKVVNNCSKKTRKSRFQKTFFNEKKKSEKVSAKKMDVCGGMWWWWWRIS